MKFGEIIKYLPILSIILIFISYLKLQFFYGNFGIQIQEYMDSGELILSFLPDIYAILIVLISLVFTVSIFFSNFAKETDNDDHEKNIQGGYRKKRLSYYFGIIKPKKLKRVGLRKVGLLLWRITTNSRFLFFLSLTIISVLQYLYGSYDCQENVLEEYDISLMIAWGLFFSFVLIENAKLYEDQRVFLPGILSIAVFVSIIALNRKVSCKSEVIKSGKSSLLLEFKNNGRMISVNDSLVYIGGTRNYLFCYDMNTLQTMVFDKNNIDELKIKKNE